MTDLEKAALKKLASDLVADLPQVLNAEVAKIPAAYAPLATALLGVLEPMLVQYLQGKVDSL